MFRKFGRAMARHDLGHDFFLNKTPGSIARRALVIGEEFFDGVVIQRGHANARLFNSAISFKVLLRNSTQPWHDFTSIKAKRFSPRTDSRFRAAAPPQPLMKLLPQPKNWRTRKTAKLSSKSKSGLRGALALEGWPSPKIQMTCVLT